MKRIILMTCVAVLAMGCATSGRTPGQKVQADAATARTVREAVDSRHYTVEFNRMMPRRFPVRTLDYGYSLRISGDSVYSNLPYMGRAYNVPYGGGDGLNFSGLLRSYRVMKRTADCTVVEMQYVCAEDTYDYLLSIYDNGGASLSVLARERDGISFTGNMLTE